MEHGQLSTLFIRQHLYISPWFGEARWNRSRSGGERMFIVACVMATAIVSVWLAAIVRIAVKNFAVERAMKTSAYWQRRARQAEARLQELTERHNEDQPWWT